MKTTFGKVTQPLGIGKLRLLELLEEVLKTNNERVFSALEECDMMATLIELFIVMQWNNCLHRVFENIIDLIINFNRETLLHKLISPNGFNMLDTFLLTCSNSNVSYTR